MFAGIRSFTVLPHLSVTHHAHLERTVLAKHVAHGTLQPLFARRLMTGRTYCRIELSLTQEQTRSHQGVPPLTRFRPPRRTYQLNAMHPSHSRIL